MQRRQPKPVQGKLKVVDGHGLSRSNFARLRKACAERKGKHKDEIIELANKCKNEVLDKLETACLKRDIELELVLLQEQEQERLLQGIRKALRDYDADVIRALEGLNEIFFALQIRLQHMGHQQGHPRKRERDDEVWNRRFGSHEYRGHPQTSKQIAADMPGMSEANVNQIIQRLKKAGRKPPYDKRRRKPH